MQSDFMASVEKKQRFASSVPEEQRPAEKKQKLEEDYTFQKSIPSSYSEIESDEEREMTDEEYKIYYDAVDASDGFDVPLFPNVCDCGMIQPMVVHSHLETLIPYSEAAILEYNHKNATDYKVVRVEKAMNQAVRGINYYITFQAYSAAAAAGKTFEAVVLLGIPEYKGDKAIKVIFCRDQGDRTVREEISDDDEEMETQDGEHTSEEVKGEGV